VFGEMRGRIHMGAVLSDHFVKCAAKSLLGDGVRLPRLRIEGRRHLRLTEARPYRRVGTETVGQIDELLTRDDPIGATELRLCLHCGDETESDRSSRKHAQTGTSEPHHSLRNAASKSSR